MGRGKKLSLNSLKKTGFFIVPKFVSFDDSVVSELKRRVMECNKRQTIFQGARRNDNRRVQAAIQALREEKSLSEDLEALLDAVAEKLRSAVPSRPVHEITVLVSLEECGPQRPHADYTQESLNGVGIGEDGMPLGVMVVLEPNTRFDAWPGAVGWNQSRFYEHAQLVVQPGDAVFFLGNAVHAGAAFGGKCEFARERGDGQRRLPDTTFFMDTFAGVANILPRGAKLP